MKEYKDILIEHGVAATIQRVKILEFLQKNRVHPTADQVYLGIKDDMVSISKATVYNVLNLFVEKKIIHALTVFGTETRFECDTNPHIHLKCIKCGKIIDISQECELHNNKIIDGHKILDYQINLQGICKECLEKIN